MAARQISNVKLQNVRRGFTRALELALFEWLLIFMLFVNAIFQYLITKFASHYELQTPCLLCSRLDHVFGHRRLKHYWDLICQKHKFEVSTLVYCHAHEKLVDVRGMCETCLFSFATINKSNAETYRLLVGKLGEHSNFTLDQGPFGGVEGSAQAVMKLCTCCNQPWIPKGFTQNLARPKSGGSRHREPDTILRSSFGFGKSDNQYSSVRANHERQLSHVDYTELKIHSDTESEAAFSDNDCDETRGLICETDNLQEDHADEPPELEPRNIASLDDPATEKLIDPVSASEPWTLISEVQSSFIKPLSHGSVEPNFHGLEELIWPQVDAKNDSSTIAELISFDDAPSSLNCVEKPANVLKESKLIPNDYFPLSSNVDESLLEASQDNIIPSSGFAVLVDASPEGICITDAVKVERRNVEGSEEHSQDKSGQLASEAAQETDCSSGISDFQGITDAVEVETTNFNDSKELYQIKSGQTVSETSQDTLHSSGNSNFKGVTDAVEVEKTNVQGFDELCQVKGGKIVSETTQETDCSLGISNSQGVPDGIEVEKTNIKESDELCPIKSEQTVPETAQERDCSPGISDFQGIPDGIEVEKTKTKGSDELRLTKSEQTMSETAQETICLSGNSNFKGVADAIEVEKTNFQGSDELCQVKDGQNVSETAQEINSLLVGSNCHATDALDLTDAYKIAVAYREIQKSRDHAEQMTTEKDSRLTEDLKALLSQISAARSTEQSVNDISPKISINGEELKSFDPSSFDGMQLLLRRASLERNESNISLEGSVVSEIEGESEIERLKRQIEHNWKLMNALYKELEEERNASAVAANQAMAMITRLQEEKATFQMEALQNLRMMEEQAEYDMEALQKTNDLLDEKEKEIQDLEAELEIYRSKFPSGSLMENIVEPVSHAQANDISERTDHILEKVEDEKVSIEDTKRATTNLLLGFEDERLNILECLDKIEKKLHLPNDEIYSEMAEGESCVTEEEDGANNSKDLNLKRELRSDNDTLLCQDTDLASLRDMVSDLNERLKALKADHTFLEHIINSLRHGEEGVVFIKEIASHMQTLRRAGMRKNYQTPS